MAPFLAQTSSPDPWASFDSQSPDMVHPIVPESNYAGLVLAGVCLFVVVLTKLNRYLKRRAGID